MIMAVGSLAAAWALLGPPAAADYPPVPPEGTTTVKPTTTVPKVTTTVAAKKVTPTTVVKIVPKVPRVVVVVRGAPQPRRALVLTGTDTAIPLTALATASVGLGVILVCVSRLGYTKRRHRRHRRTFA